MGGGLRKVESFEQVWVDLCWCPRCQDFFWHIEVADEAERDGYVPRCPDCGGAVDAIRDNGGRCFR
jgi:hypothetical protein